MTVHEEKPHALHNCGPFTGTVHFLYILVGDNTEFIEIVANWSRMARMQPLVALWMAS